MSEDRSERQDFLRRLRGAEPADALGVVAPAPVLRAGQVRETRVTPHERRRRGRRMGVTFSSAEIAERVRALAERWGLLAPDGKSPNTSAVIEYLLMVVLERAERGEIEPPRGVVR